MAKYLKEHRPEVEKIMLTMMTPEYIQMAAARSMKIKGSIETMRLMNMPEEDIKNFIIRQYDLTTRYAQNFLDDDTKPEDCRPMAI